MSFKVEFTPEAEDTFVSVTAQVQIRWGEKFVIILEMKITNAINNISTDPYLYPPAGKNINVRKCVLHGNCSMIYSIKSDHIDIICFWDNRQEPMNF